MSALGSTTRVESKTIDDVLGKSCSSNCAASASSVAPLDVEGGGSQGNAREGQAGTLVEFRTDRVREQPPDSPD